MLLALGVPRPADDPPPATWDVLVLVVTAIDVEVPSATGRRRIEVEAGPEDVAGVRREVSAFAHRVERGTRGAMRIRPRVVVAREPVTTLSGTGPYWISPRDVAHLLAGPAAVGRADTVLVFAKIGGDDGPAVPVRHLGGAIGGDLGPGGACFAAVTYRPRWLDGSGTAPLHEWLHGLDWALAEVAGFPDDAVPDPDDGRRGPTCCPDAPRGDSAFADHILREHLSIEMLRAADARRGPARDDGYLRAWTLDDRPRRGACRTVTLARGARTAEAHLPADTGTVEVVTSHPVRVAVDGGTAVRVSRRGFVPADGFRLVVTPAVGGAEIRFRVRVAPAPTAP